MIGDEAGNHGFRKGKEGADIKNPIRLYIKASDRGGKKPDRRREGVGKRAVLFDESLLILSSVVGAGFTLKVKKNGLQGRKAVKGWGRAPLIMAPDRLKKRESTKRIGKWSSSSSPPRGLGVPEKHYGREDLRSVRKRARKRERKSINKGSTGRRY